MSDRCLGDPGPTKAGISKTWKEYRHWITARFRLARPRPLQVTHRRRLDSSGSKDDEKFM
jgi:hypothetical protein